MNWLDKIIAAVSPAAAFQREAWRQAWEELRGYDAAGHDRLNSGWRVVNQSAELTDRPGRDMVRARARDLERNSDIAQPGPVLDVDAAGHFTKESLQKLTKAELADLAEDMKVDLSQCRTKPEMVDALAAVSAKETPAGGFPDATDTSGTPAAPEAVTT